MPEPQVAAVAADTTDALAGLRAVSWRLLTEPLELYDRAVAATTFMPYLPAGTRVDVWTGEEPGSQVSALPAPPA